MNILMFQNFDLLILPTSTGYSARVINSPLGEAQADFTLPFTAAELRTFFWLSQRFTRSARLMTELLEEPEQPLDHQQFGARLYDAVFANAVGDLLQRSLDEVDRAGDGLRIRLRLDESIPDLADLPWEYLYAPSLDRFLALSEQTPIVRYIELAQRAKPVTVTPPLRIVTVVADPSDVVKLEVEKEWARLQNALSELIARKLVVLERLEQATTAALHRRLRRRDKGDVHILHFIGHGYFNADANKGGLVFEDERKERDDVSAEELAVLLHDHRPLRLVYLNACEGARSGTTGSFAGVAQKLVQQRVPAVLAMQFEVSDQAAIALAHEFYQALADGYGVDAAVSAARKAIFVQGDRMEWGTPVLFMRTPDGRIFGGEPETKDDDQATAASGVNIQIDNSTVTGSTFNIGQNIQQSGRDEKPNEGNSPFSAFNKESEAAASERLSQQLTETEGQIRRVYRQLIDLEDQQLFSDDAAEKAALQSQIDQLANQVRTLLSSYQGQAKALAWQIPLDIQTAITRFGT